MAGSFHITSVRSFLDRLQSLRGITWHIWKKSCCEVFMRYISITQIFTLEFSIYIEQKS